MVIQYLDREAMSRIIKVAAFSMLLGAVSTGAFAADTGAFFINGNIGQSHFDGQEFSEPNDTTVAARIGYAWHVGDAGDVGVEAGFADLGQARDAMISNFDTAYVKAKLSGPLVGANYKYTFGNKMFVSVRGGWFRSKFDVSGPGAFSQSFSGDGAYGGVGVGYDFTQQFGLGVNLDEYHGGVTVYGMKSSEDVRAISGFAEYRF